MAIATLAAVAVDQIIMEPGSERVMMPTREIRTLDLPEDFSSSDPPAVYVVVAQRKVFR
jgi:hypothetical protein